MKNTISLAVGPKLADSCLTLSAARVPPRSFYGAVNALARLEAYDPGRTSEVASQLLEAWPQVEDRHQFLDEFQPFLVQAVDISAATLIESGDEALIAQALAFQDMSRPCETGWDELDQVISAALIDKEGIRKSLFNQADEAQAAYELGFYEASGEKLNALINHVDAQEGKHIDPVSAAAIRDTVRDLAIGLNIPLHN